MLNQFREETEVEVDGQIKDGSEQEEESSGSERVEAKMVQEEEMMEKESLESEMEVEAEPDEELTLEDLVARHKSLHASGLLSDDTLLLVLADAKEAGHEEQDPDIVGAF